MPAAAIACPICSLDLYLYVEFTGTEGLVPTRAHQGADDNLDSDVVQIGFTRVGCTPVVTLAANQQLLGMDAGFTTSAFLTNIVYNDADRNGVREEGEPLVANAVIVLHDEDGNEVARSSTDNDGIYTFEGMFPGIYSVDVFPPNGFVKAVEGRSTLAPFDPGDTAVVETPLIIDPTAVDLISFTVRRVGDLIIVRWVTSAEYKTLGFHVDVSGQGIRNSIARLTPQMILSKGSAGGVYEVVILLADIPGTDLRQLSFWLKEMELSNRVITYGPALLVIESIYLPLFTRQE